MSSYPAPSSPDVATEATASKKYANRHIPRFLALSPPPNALQIVTNGKFLTAQSLCDERYNASVPIYVTDTAESIGMTVPHDLTMRTLGQIIGPGYPVSVIDVEHQEELEGWTLGDLVEYFEDEDRKLVSSNEEQDETTVQQQEGSRRRQRKTATSVSAATAAPKVLNQISLEFRNTPLAGRVKSPQFVRDLDWIDNAWNADKKLERPQTQYYCLTSTAGCYTDFHVDFGGTSVWYHILTGVKHFVLIPPTTEHLQVYEDWLCRPNQAELFLPDLMTEEQQETIQKVVLRQGQTLFIPCGWIHAVYTPTDSLVMGGNFLHGLDIPKQIDVHSLEMRTRVPAKFRFPKYLGLAMYAGIWYVKKLRRGAVCRKEVEGLPIFIDALRQWSRVPSDPHMVQAMADIEHVEEMLENLQHELDRMERQGSIGPNPDYKVEVVVAAPVVKKTKLRLKLTEPSSTPSFRITLSSGSQFSSVPTTTNKRKAPREDLDYISNRNDDDEWKPSARLVSTTTAAPTIHPKKRPSGKKPTAAAAKKASSTSRQRLMKRFR